MNCSACYDLLLSPLEKRFLSVCRSRLCAGLSGQIVEAGAGTGLNFSHYGNHCRVLAIEPDAAMRERACQRANSHIEVVAGRAEQIPLPAHSVDHWVGTLVLCSVNEVATVLAEARRVLKPEGRLHLLEHERGSAAWGRVHDLLTPAWSWLSGGCHLNRRPRLSLENAGFRLDSWETVFRVGGSPFQMGSARPV